MAARASEIGPSMSMDRKHSNIGSEMNTHSEDTAGVAAVDERIIQELREEGGDLLADLVGMFVEEVPGQLTELEAALRKGDAGATRLTAHTLKGTAGNFGASQMQTLARRDRDESPRRRARRGARDVRSVTCRVRAGSRGSRSRTISEAARCRKRFSSEARRQLRFEEVCHLPGGVLRIFQWWKMPASFHYRKLRSLDLPLIKPAMLQRYKPVSFAPQNQSLSFDPI